ncbi:hypothetical protein I552_2770 [Mycobacterium xenopi 3993]|nr:hypothetical protein I552_2770 [Mycobacterium xenopi 3993]
MDRRPTGSDTAGNALVVGRRARRAGQRRIQRHHHGPGAGIGHAIEAAHDAAGPPPRRPRIVAWSDGSAWAWAWSRSRCWPPA